MVAALNADFSTVAVRCRDRRWLRRLTDRLMRVLDPVAGPDGLDAREIDDGRGDHRGRRGQIGDFALR
ncbi:hypothetical protein [Mycobacterium shigaense]|uniref:hypothetical protein n=1 Tax=Mycobacterium shigaense TaxID=722731 RepID=UPI000BBAC633|nr:hypothetical protein [Mycobacterium shigaense]PRI14424.1 hypothetical protein B2J96_13775 [Mycobacterium shigaense]